MSELRALAEAATPGPWEWVTTVGPRYKSMLVGNGPATWDVATHNWTGTRIIHEALDGPTVDDAEYIVAANPSAVLALLDERDALRDCLDQIEMECVAWERCTGQDVEESVRRLRAVFQVERVERALPRLGGEVSPRVSPAPSQTEDTE